MRELRPELDLRIPIERSRWRSPPRQRYGLNVDRGAFQQRFLAEERARRYLEAEEKRQREFLEAQTRREETRRAEAEEVLRRKAAAQAAEEERIRIFAEELRKQDGEWVSRREKALRADQAALASNDYDRWMAVFSARRQAQCA
jgi:hypothetical protein